MLILFTIQIHSQIFQWESTRSGFIKPLNTLTNSYALIQIDTNRKLLMIFEGELYSLFQIKQSSTAKNGDLILSIKDTITEDMMYAVFMVDGKLVLLHPDGSNYLYYITNKNKYNGIKKY